MPSFSELRSNEQDGGLYRQGAARQFFVGRSGGEQSVAMLRKQTPDAKLFIKDERPEGFSDVSPLDPSPEVVRTGDVAANVIGYVKTRP